MNHLEQLASEWLEYNDYIVKAAIPVGPRERGGYEGELDVVGYNFETEHLIHIECSLDALSKSERDKKFREKFNRGRKFIRDIFKGFDIPIEKLDQVVLHQFATSDGLDIGGGRLVTVRSLIHEIYEGLGDTTPAKGAVPSNFPLLRTLQVAKDAGLKGKLTNHRLIPTQKA